MPQIEIAFVLPYFLLLETGDYSTGLDGRNYHLHLQDIDNTQDGAFPKRTQASALFQVALFLTTTSSAAKFGKPKNCSVKPTDCCVGIVPVRGAARLRSLLAPKQVPSSFGLPRETFQAFGWKKFHLSQARCRSILGQRYKAQQRPSKKVSLAKMILKSRVCFCWMQNRHCEKAASGKRFCFVGVPLMPFSI